MRGKRVKVLMIIAAIAVGIFGLRLVRDVRERHKAAEREVNYQTVLAKYSSALKPGVTREKVERHLQTGGTRFRQMCCVANFRGQYVSGVGAGWDDLVKIGEAPHGFAARTTSTLPSSSIPSPKASLPIQMVQTS